MSTTRRGLEPGDGEELGDDDVPENIKNTQKSCFFGF